MDTNPYPNECPCGHHAGGECPEYDAPTPEPDARAPEETTSGAPRCGLCGGRGRYSTVGHDGRVRSWVCDECGLRAPSYEGLRRARNEALEEAAQECIKARAEKGIGLDASYFAARIRALAAPSSDAAKEQP
jgi:hypothetical protein